MKFTLDFPRRITINLFPRKETGWLAILFVATTAADFGCIEGLNAKNEKLADMTKRERMGLSLFQAVSNRAAGFTVFNLRDLRDASQVTTAWFISIALIPIGVFIRNTNVFEIRHVTLSASHVASDGLHQPSKLSVRDKIRLFFHFKFLAQEIMAQAAWAVGKYLVFVIIVLAARYYQPKDPSMTYQTFDTLFEVASALSNSGESLGALTSSTSYSSEYDKAPTIAIIIAMWVGRNRCLPASHDLAVELQMDRAYQWEEEDGKRLENQLQQENLQASSPDPARESDWEDLLEGNNHYGAEDSIV